MRLKPATLGILALATLAALSAWMVYRYDTRSLRVSTGGEDEPDYYFENFRGTRMDAEGQPLHVLEGTRLTHFPGNERLELESPHLTAYTREGAPWLIDAESAWVTEDGNVIELLDEVTINRAESAHNRPMTILARDVRVLVTEEYLATDQAVSVVSGSDMIASHGMRAFLKQGRVELLSEVRASHEPIAH